MAWVWLGPLEAGEVQGWVGWMVCGWGCTMGVQRDIHGMMLAILNISKTNSIRDSPGALWQLD